MIYLAENGSGIMSQTEGKYLESLRKRYAKARKKERGQILTSMCRRPAIIANMPSWC